MDDLLPKLLAFPPHPPPKNPLSDAQYDEGIKAQISAVAKIADNKLLQQTSGGENVLDVINPATNTVPYIYILNAHCTAASKGSKATDLDTLYDKIENFLFTFDGRQTRYLGKELENLIDFLVQVSRQNRQPFRPIPAITSAVLRVDPTGSILTSNHLLLVKLALESRVFDTVLPVLDKYILYFPGSTNLPKPKYICELDLPPTAYITATSFLTTKLKYQDVLEYFLYCGMVYIATNRWESALESLESAVTYPVKDSSSVSKIMVEAYKKWVLVGVLLEGRPLPLPKATSNAAAKSYHVTAKPYESLAQIFETATASRLKAEGDAGRHIWQNDCNTGLVQKVLAAYQKFQIRNLGKIFSKISIPEIVSQTQSAETGSKLSSAQAAEQLVEDMISDGTLHATLSHSPNGPSILTFSPSGPVLTEAQMKIELAASTDRIQTLTQEIRQTDRMLTHEKEYIKYAQKQKKNKNATLSALEGDMPMDWNQDEELMGDLF